MPFSPIDLARGSDIRFELRRVERSVQPFLSIIHAAFSGTYRTGSAGAPDAHYIRGTINILYDIWHPSGIILDLTELNYQWGDEMDLVLESPSEMPFAIVVGPECEPAISSLCYGINATETVLDRSEFFDSFRAAFDYIRRQVVEDWNERIARNPLLSETTKLIDINGLE